MGEEVELKLEIAPGHLPDVLKSEPLTSRGIRFRPPRHLVTTYYDTAKHALRKKGVFLRIRQDGRAITQTVKTSGDGGVLATRGEWDWPLQAATPDLALAGETGLKVLDKQLKKQHVLKALFASDLKRRGADLESPESKLELALDEGVVRAGRRETPLTELEIEVKHGAPGPVFALARELVALPGIRVGFETKASRGFALADGAPLKFVKAKALTLDAAMRPVDAAALMLDSCAVQAAGNITVLAERPVGEAVHQLRVAMRRLKAALALFKDVMNDERRHHLKSECSWLAGLMGPARDLDVMSGGTLKAASAPRTMASEMRALSRALLAARKEAWAAAIEAVRSSRASLLLLDLAETAIELRSEMTDPTLPSLTDFAREQLDARLHAVFEAAGGIDTLTIDGRHNLRLALKKLRYAADFFENLFPRKVTKAGIKALSRLQDALGAFNDAASVDRIVSMASHHVSARSRPAHDRATLFVSGWAAHQAATAWGDTRNLWRDFAETDPFWR